MRGTRLLVLLSVLGLSGNPPRPIPQAAVPRPTDRAASPLVVESGRTVLRWPGDLPGTPVLVIASLGDPATRYTVELRSSPAPPRQAGADLETSARLVVLRPYSLRPAAATATAAGGVRHSVRLVAAVGGSRMFDIPLLNGRPAGDGGTVRVRASLLCAGDRVRVFLDDMAPRSLAAEELAQSIIDWLEGTVMPAGDRILGPPADIDGDGTLAILLSPWLSRLERGDTSVGGFVRSNDFRQDRVPPLGNHSDLIYLNTALTPGGHLRDVLSHEYMHVLACSWRTARGLRSEEDWLNEAIAHLGETGTTNIARRIDTFLESPERFPLVVPDYHRACRWRCHGCRGAVFLFLHWCRQQHGEDLPGRLIASELHGTRNVAAVTGRPFAALFRGWTVALLALPESGRLHRPRIARWQTRSPRSLRLFGTAVHYLRPETDDSQAGEMLIEIVAPASARLQVTLALLPGPAGRPVAPVTEPPRR